MATEKEDGKTTTSIEKKDITTNEQKVTRKVDEQQEEPKKDNLASTTTPQQSVTKMTSEEELKREQIDDQENNINKDGISDTNQNKDTENNKSEEKLYDGDSQRSVNDDKPFEKEAMNIEEEQLLSKESGGERVEALSTQLQLEKELEEKKEQQLREKEAIDQELSKVLYGSRLIVKNRKKLKNASIFLQYSRLQLKIFKIKGSMTMPTPTTGTLPQGDDIFDHPELAQLDEEPETPTPMTENPLTSPITSPSHVLKSKAAIAHDVLHEEYVEEDALTLIESIPFRRIISIRDDTNRTKQYYGFTVSYLPYQASVIKQLTCHVLNDVLNKKWIRHLKIELYGTRGKLIKYNKVNTRKALIIANPVAGKRDGMFLFKKYARPILDASDITYDICLTEREHHATTIARETKLVGVYQLIIVAGGDGTLHETLQGLFDNKHHNYTDVMQIPLGMIPIGTSNAVATDVGVPHPDGSPVSIAESAFIVARGRYLQADIASCLKENKRYYSFMMTSWGVVADVETRSQWLRSLGSLRVTLAAVFYVLKNKYAEAELSFVHADAFETQAKDVFLKKGRRFGNTFTKRTNHIMYPPHHPPVPYLLKYFRKELQEIVPSMVEQLEKELRVFKRELVFANVDDEAVNEISDEDLSRMVISIERSMKSQQRQEQKMVEQENLKSPSYRFASLLSPMLVRKSPKILSIESDEDSWESDDDPSEEAPILTPHSIGKDKNPEDVIYEKTAQRKQVNDSFFNITVSNIPHLAQNFYSDPYAALNSGLLHLYYINRKSGASDKLKLMKGMNTGDHIHNPSASFAATKAVLIRPNNKKKSSTLIDGEEYSSSPVLIEVHPSAGKLFVSEEYVDPYHHRYDS